MRIDQDLADVPRLITGVGESTQRVWNGWKSLLQMNPRHARTNRRMTDAVFFDRVYSVWDSHDFEDAVVAHGTPPLPASS